MRLAWMTTGRRGQDGVDRTGAMTEKTESQESTLYGSHTDHQTQINNYYSLCDEKESAEGGPAAVGRVKYRWLKSCGLRSACVVCRLRCVVRSH